MTTSFKLMTIPMSIVHLRENTMDKKRGAHRKGAYPRMKVTRTFSPELLDALDEITPNQSEFIEEWMWEHPKLKERKQQIMERTKYTGNPLCRVLLKGEKHPRENVEVFTNNQKYGIAFLGDRQVHVTSGWGGWYESGMQLLEAEARLTQTHH